MGRKGRALASVESRAGTRPKVSRPNSVPLVASGADVRTLTRPARHILVLPVCLFPQPGPCPALARLAGPLEDQRRTTLSHSGLHHVNSCAPDHSRQDCWQKGHVVIPHTAHDLKHPQIAARLINEWISPETPPRAALEY
jgi:hypothetical protein